MSKTVKVYRLKNKYTNEDYIGTTTQPVKKHFNYILSRYNTKLRPNVMLNEFLLDNPREHLEIELCGEYELSDLSGIKAKLIDLMLKST